MPLPFGIELSDLREGLASLLPRDGHQAMARNGDADAILTAAVDYYATAAAVDTGSESEDDKIRAFIDAACKASGYVASAVVVPRIEAVAASQSVPE